MDDEIKISLDRISAIVQMNESVEFSTADVIRGYCGGFFSNTGTPAYYSFNAQFGKILKYNMDRLGIREVATNVRVTDDRGHETSTSTWVRSI